MIKRTNINCRNEQKHKCQLQKWSNVKIPSAEMIKKTQAWLRSSLQGCHLRYKNKKKQVYWRLHTTQLINQMTSLGIYFSYSTLIIFQHCSWDDLGLCGSWTQYSMNNFVFTKIELSLTRIRRNLESFSFLTLVRIHVLEYILSKILRFT